MGGRFVLVTSSIVGAFGFAALATSSTFVTFLAAWTLLGVAIALGLYGHVLRRDRASRTFQLSEKRDRGDADRRPGEHRGLAHVTTWLSLAARTRGARPLDPIC
jgi:hypothetical protein